MNINKMMKQVQQAQQRMAEVQEQLAAQQVEASSGGGMVRVVLGGDGTVKQLLIDREVVDKDDVEMLQDLIVAAVNEGKRRASELAAREMQKAAGALGLPPGIL
ncbi:MAG: YbaB/EbfC family nucleoid-associated protein [Candidatus Eiseniibacteriota bacterium]